MWRNQEVAMSHLALASRKAPTGSTLNKQLLSLKSQMLKEISKSEELSIMLETTVTTSRYDNHF